jgi:hypothetical protein
MRLSGPHSPVVIRDFTLTLVSPLSRTASKSSPSVSLTWSDVIPSAGGGARPG